MSIKFDFAKTTPNDYLNWNVIYMLFHEFPWYFRWIVCPVTRSSKIKIFTEKLGTKDYAFSMTICFHKFKLLSIAPGPIFTKIGTKVLSAKCLAQWPYFETFPLEKYSELQQFIILHKTFIRFVVDFKLMYHIFKY